MLNRLGIAATTFFIEILVRMNFLALKLSVFVTGVCKRSVPIKANEMSLASLKTIYEFLSVWRTSVRLEQDEIDHCLNNLFEQRRALERILNQSIESRLISDKRGISLYRDKSFRFSLERWTNDLDLLVENGRDVSINNQEVPSRVIQASANVEKRLRRSGIYSPRVSVIYPFRDREISRLKQSIRSMESCSNISFTPIVVDYGSIECIRDELKEFCRQNGVENIRAETQGRPWSRAHAINIGIRACQTDFLVTTDIDMIFADDILNEAFKRFGSNRVIHCRPLWLPPDGNIQNAWLGDYNQLGGFQFVDRNVFEEVGGFNEDIRFWGLEDVEMDIRLKRHGYENVWVDDMVKMYHVWHKPSYGPLDMRPESSWNESLTIMMKTLLGQNKPTSHWGRNVMITDRPILNWMKNAKPGKYTLTENFANEVAKVVCESRKHEFIEVILGARFRSNAAHKVIDKIETCTSQIKSLGFEIVPIKNRNLDYFYQAIPQLQELGLTDYYLNQEFNAVWLLFADSLKAQNTFVS